MHGVFGMPALAYAPVPSPVPSPEWGTRPRCGRTRWDVLGYATRVHRPGEHPADVTVVVRVTLFRNWPDLRFEFRIREQILPAIRRGGRLARSVRRVPRGRPDGEGKRRRLGCDRRLLKLEPDDRLGRPFVPFDLGMTGPEAGRLAEARDHLWRCVAAV